VCEDAGVNSLNLLQGHCWKILYSSFRQSSGKHSLPFFFFKKKQLSSTVSILVEPTNQRERFLSFPFRNSISRNRTKMPMAPPIIQKIGIHLSIVLFLKIKKPHTQVYWIYDSHEVALSPAS
jgi:hypothetical protein